MICSFSKADNEKYEQGKTNTEVVHANVGEYWESKRKSEGGNDRDGLKEGKFGDKSQEMEGGHENKTIIISSQDGH